MAQLPEPSAKSEAKSTQGHHPPMNIEIGQELRRSNDEMLSDRLDGHAFEELVIPHRRTRSPRLGSNNPYRPRPPAVPLEAQTYDGAGDKIYDSRVTSTSWSTVSRVSHRVFSDSSAAHWKSASAKFNIEFNSLASKYGLPKLKPNEDSSSIQSTSKDHKHGWFARKLFPRPSLTHTYKAKTTYKPVSRKMSFSRAPSFSDDGRKNILEGKTLEEICRLGGLSVLTLPPKYSVGSLNLPTCLSVAGKFLLEHGVNAPGLFRIPGQSAVVNALYDYYANQFGNAGSPTKVQATVQPGQLPLHVDSTLADVASFFKKVVKGLPGGLLGSLELFEAIQGIFLNLQRVPSLTDQQMTMLRAKLIALAILSVPSSPRTNLIQALLGLVAHFGDEAKAARNPASKILDGTRDDGSRPELMDHQSLGVCLGPLLVGDQFDHADRLEADNERNSRSRAEFDSKTSKKKRSAADNKLETSENLAKQVNRANLAANVMQLLLIVWSEVVKQLRILVKRRNVIGLHNNSQRDRTAIPRGSKYSIQVTDEELLFLDILRGRKLSEDYPFDVLVKRKVKAKTRSSIPGINAKSSCNFRPGISLLTNKNDDSLLESQDIRKEELATKSTNNLSSLSTSNQDLRPLDQAEQATWTPVIERSHYCASSDDDMAMGQFLPPKKSLPRSTKSASSSLRRSATRTPASRDASLQGFHRSTASTPAAGRSMVVLAFRSSPNSTHRHARTLEKPLPPMKIGLPPPPVEPSSKRRPSLPSRKSQLEVDEKGSQPTVEGASHNSEGDQPFEANNRPENSSADVRQPPIDGVNCADPSIHVPSQRRDPSDPKVTPHHPPSSSTTLLVAQSSSSEDPFFSISSNSTPQPKESLIPKPKTNLGRVRDSSSRSPSPPKRKSVYNIIDNNATSSDNVVGESPVCTSLPYDENGKHSSDKGSTPRRALLGYSTGSPKPFDKMQIARYVHRPTRSSDYAPPAAPETILTSVRSNSNNATLYAEITRLKKQNEQREETNNALRRSLDAARATKEEGPPPEGSGNPKVSYEANKRGSWNKGTLSEKIRDAQQERDHWKQIAERGRRNEDYWKRKAETQERKLRGLRRVGEEMGRRMDKISTPQSAEERNGKSWIVEEGEGSWIQISNGERKSGEDGAIKEG